MFKKDDMVHSDYYGVGYVHKIDKGPYPIIVNFSGLKTVKECFTKHGYYFLGSHLPADALKFNKEYQSDYKDIFLIPEVPAECSLNYQVEQELNHTLRKRSFFRTLQDELL